MPNATIIKETYVCPIHPNEHKKGNENFFLIIDGEIQFYPKAYKRVIKSKAVDEGLMPLRIGLMGCNICFVETLRKVINAGLAEFKDNTLPNYESLLNTDKGGYYSSIEYTCRNSDSPRYHHGSLLNKTGEIIITGQINCRVADFSRYYALKNRVLRIDIDFCSHCWQKPLPEIDIVMNQRVIDKVLKNPGFQAHDPERTQSYLMGIFGSLQQDHSEDQR